MSKYDCENDKDCCFYFISYLKYNDEEIRFEIASKQSSIFNFKAIISSIIIRDFSIVKIKNKTTF